MPWVGEWVGARALLPGEVGGGGDGMSWWLWMIGWTYRGDGDELVVVDDWMDV